MGMSNSFLKTTPGGRPAGAGNPPPSSDGAVGQSCSGGPAAYSMLHDSEESLLRLGGATPDVNLLEEGGRDRMRAAVRMPKWYRRKSSWVMLFSCVFVPVLIFAQITHTHLTLVFTVKPRLDDIQLRLTTTQTDLTNILVELQVICRIVTAHDDCREMQARLHNKIMHIQNGNIPVGKNGDPNPPADPQLKGSEMKSKVNTVGPISFQFDDEAARRVQAMIAHPLLEAASNNVSILNNHVRPSRHAIVSSYRPTHWNTHNISSRSYVGMFYKIVPDSQDEKTQETCPKKGKDGLVELIMKGLPFIVSYDTPNQVSRDFDDDLAEKFSSGKYGITYEGQLVMKSQVRHMRVFTPNQVRVAKRKIAGIRTEIVRAEISSIESDENSDFVEVKTVVMPDATQKPDKDDPTPPPPPVDPPVQTVWPLYSDMIPVRVIIASSTNYETMPHPTYTALKVAIDEINADKMGAGLSMNLVRGWNQTDINSLNLMVNKVGKSSDSFFEEAALVRCGCVLNSIVPDAYSIDPTTRRFVRRAKHGWTQTRPRIAKHKTYPKGFNFIVTTTDMVGIYLTSKTYPPALVGPFKSSALDKDWTVIPIDPSKYSGNSVVAYITSFLDSSLWEGSVNYVVDRVVTDDAGADVKVRYVTMPTCNSVRIPGRKNFMLVLANTIGMNAPDSTMIGATRCDVWRNFNDAPTIYDFAPIWFAVWSSEATDDMMEDLSMHFVRAWNVISDTLATMDTVGRAASVIAELSSNYTYGIARADWSEGGAVTAAWTIGGGSLDRHAAMMTTRDMFTGCIGAANEKGRKRLVAYNFGYHSAWMSFAQSVARTSVHRLDQSANPDKCEIYWDKVTYSSPQYSVKEASSFYRLCMTCGLIETTHQTIPMMSPYGFQNWVNAHGILLAMATADFVNQSGIPPTSWFLSTEIYDALTSTTMSNANEALTLGLAKPGRMADLMASDAADWNWNVVSEYFGFPITDNEYDTMMPIGSSSILQWLEKTQQPIPHLTLHTSVVKWITAGAYSNNRAILLHNTDRISSLVAGSSPDMLFTEYQVRVDWSCQDAVRYAYIWCEQPEMETATDSEYSNMLQEPSKLATQAFVLSNKSWPSQLNDIQRSWIIRSLSDDNSDMPPQVTSPLILPDPIDWAAFLEGIRDWVVYPAAQGGLGYLAGGIPGAVLGVGAELLSKIKREATGNTKEIVAPMSTVADQVREAMLREAQETGSTVQPSRIAELAKTEVLKGPREESHAGTSGQQTT